MAVGAAPSPRWVFESGSQSGNGSGKRFKVRSLDTVMRAACRKKPATQVHHLTYKRVGREMLFDLVAVCADCHEVVHEEPEGG